MSYFNFFRVKSPYFDKCCNENLDDYKLRLEDIENVLVIGARTRGMKLHKPMQKMDLMYL